MTNWILTENRIIKLNYGYLLGNKDLIKEVRTYCVDSRHVGPGSLFFALKGERTDGHKYVESTVQARASGICVKESEFVKKRSNWEALLDESFFWIVPDTLIALQKLAEARLEEIDALRIGITGSNGKTTTKELLGSVLKRWKNTFVTPGNYNSEIGLPLSALSLTGTEELVLFEMGTNRPGEIELLADLVKPSIAIITNIGRAHIGPLGSQKGIALEKKSIFKHLGRKGSAIIPGEDPFKDILKEGIDGTILEFSLKDPDLVILENRGILGWRFKYRDLEIDLHLSGQYNLLNALAVVKAALALKVPGKYIKDGIESVRGFAGRGEVLVKSGITIFKDCYNANLDSMKAMLMSLKEMPQGKDALLVLGAMKELGEQSHQMHQELGAIVYDLNPAGCFLVGEETKHTEQRLKDLGYAGELFWAPQVDQILDNLRRRVKSGDFLVLKGSRSYALETICEIF